MDYYGQNEDEQIILKYLPDALTRKGKYVDIGGGGAAENSNTYLFYKHGWEGLVVEPWEKYYNDQKALRPNQITLRKSISNYVGISKHIDTATKGSPVGDIYEFDLKERYDGLPFTHYEVECTTMDQLIKDYPTFAEPDFVNIDIDTAEDKLLEKCDFTIFKPKIIVIEYTVRGVDYRKVWGHRLAPFYDLMEVGTGSNAFYLRKA